MPDRSKLGGLRGVALIVIGIFMGATLITPAVAHVGGTISHLWGARPATSSPRSRRSATIGGWERPPRPWTRRTPIPPIPP
jgi:hypothetical protein